jgi:hypothetical protein
MQNQELRLVSARKNAAAQRREDIRDQLWEGAAAEVWNRKKEFGYITIPRTLPLLMTLIDELAKGKNASQVYCELWCRTFDEGLVEVDDEEEMSFASGYVTPGRGVRTWRERIEILRKYGFIRVKPRGTRKYGYILLRHPHQVVMELRSKKLISNENWWGSFLRRTNEIKAKLPKQGTGK